VAAVLAEGRLGPRDPRTTDPTSWWGILPPAPPTGTARGALAGISAVAVIALCACWLTLTRRALTGQAGPRTTLAAALAWAAPFALGPPLFSRDAYAYAAQGELARRGLDPATHGVVALTGQAGAAFSDAVDPRWRATHTPYGGGAVAVEKAAAAIAHAVGGGPVVALVVLRLVAVVSVAVLAVCTVRLVPGHAARPGAGRAAPPPGGPARRDRQVALVLALAVANPVTVIHLVGGMHLDALVTAALAAALLAESRAHSGRAGSPDRRTGAAHGARAHVRARPGDAGVGRWPAALAGGTVAATALATFAGTIKATAFLGLGWLIVAHARDARARARAAAARPAELVTGPPPDRLDRPGQPAGRRRAQAAAMAPAVLVDLTVAATVLALSMLASGFGPTWLGALKTSGVLTTGIAPVSLLAKLLAALARLVGWRVSSGSGSALLGACRTAGLGAAAVVVAVLLWRAWHREDPSPAARRVAAGRLDVAAGRLDVAAGRLDVAAGRLDGTVVLGGGGLAVALGSPVIYPWYLAPALPMLALLIASWLPAPAGEAAKPAAPVPGAPEDAPVNGAAAGGAADRAAPGGSTAHDPARRRRQLTAVVVAGLSVWLCGATMSPLGPTWQLLAPDGPAGAGPLAGTLTAAAALLVLAAAATARAARRRRRAAGPARPGGNGRFGHTVRSRPGRDLRP
jgi:hypothetical protein